MSKIHTLLRESTSTQSSMIGRPNLVALTRATTKLIYSDLVAEQRTTQPIAAMYGVKYLTAEGDLSFVTGATYGGQVSAADRATLTEFTPGMTMLKGVAFKYKGVVYRALEANPFTGTTGVTEEEQLQEALLLLKIRTLPDAAKVTKYEGDSPISDAKFEIKKWNAEVKSRKLKSSLTIELAQDMEANGLDSPNFVEDLLATEMADEINKDICQSLFTVSRRYKVAGLSDNGIIDLTSYSHPEGARTLYGMVCEMVSHIQRTTTYTATYVVASSRVAAILAGSGWLRHKPEDDKFLSPNAYGFLNNGLPVFCDVNTPADYVTVGVKEDFGEKEMVGSLFYAPYTEGLDLDDSEHVGSFKVIVDPDSLQPSVALMVRYALAANPYTVAKDDKEARIIDASDMDLMAGQSDMSVLLGVKLPKLLGE